MKKYYKYVVWFVLLLVFVWLVDEGLLKYGLWGLIILTIGLFAFNLYRNWDLYKNTVNLGVSQLEAFDAVRKHNKKKGDKK